MARKVLPTNDNSRGETIAQMVKAAAGDRAKGNNYIFEDTLNRLTAFAPTFSAELDKISESKSVRIRETREKNDALAALVMCASHACHSIKNRVTRRGEPTDVYSHYQMPVNGTLPRLRPDLATLGVAKRMVAGDAAAVAAGFDAMVNPDAAELSAAIANVEKEMEELTAADREYDQVSESIADLRDKANDIIADVVDELEFNLRKMDDASARRIMRTYGVEFISASGETVAE